MSDTPTVDLTSGWWRGPEDDDPDVEARSERIRRAMAELREIHKQFLAERGGKPIPVEVIDQALDEIRGRVDADLN